MGAIDDNKGLRTFLLAILTLSVLVLTVVAIMYYNRLDSSGELVAYSKYDDVVYKGDIFPEHIKKRDQMVAQMPRTTMHFYESKYNFGVVREDTVLKHTFRFKNTGDNPLMIAKADVTCGCTVPEYPTETIAPGADGEITVSYNTKGKSGLQQKNILIHSNANPEAISVSIEADVR